jgi:hypothetical protein
MLWYFYGQRRWLKGPSNHILIWAEIHWGHHLKLFEIFVMIDRSSSIRVWWIATKQLKCAILHPRHAREFRRAHTIKQFSRMQKLTDHQRLRTCGCYHLDYTRVHREIRVNYSNFVIPVSYRCVNLSQKTSYREDNFLKHFFIWQITRAFMSYYEKEELRVCVAIDEV